MNLAQPTCLLCKAQAAKHLNTQEKLLVGVTSDSKPWPHMGELFYCEQCGHVQKQRSAQWLHDIAQIYADYSVHAVQGGDEQLCFDNEGKAKARARLVVESLDACLNLPTYGQMLDFGCGTGGFLRHFGAVKPHWKLYGQELCVHFRDTVMSIPHVHGFYNDVHEATERFDVITLNDVLEHLTDPVSVLLQLRTLLKPQGVIFVRSPSFMANPFDLAITDHCSHFTTNSLRFLLHAAHMESATPYTFMPKEIGFIAKISMQHYALKRVEQHFDDAGSAFQMLMSTIDTFAQNVSECNYILGCSVAGVWTAHMLEQRMHGCITGFLDEDSTRHGTKGPMGLPVSSIEQCKKNAVVFLPFPTNIAQALKARLSKAYPFLHFVCS